MSRVARAAAAATFVLGLFWTVAATPTVLAADPTFGTASAESPLGGPSLFRTTITADAEPRRVEALVSQAGSEVVTVVLAEVSGGSGGTWNAAATIEGHILPNTQLSYRFRVTDANGQQFVSPTSELLTVDDRFAWQELNGAVVRLHWNGGTQAFGQRALDIGERAVANAAQLLGVTETDPIDFFIYDSEQDFRDAFGPGTRENVAGTAINETRTMFAFILPAQIDQEWVDVLVAHELTHLVFDTATRNDYRRAPHWLNEGIATYLSEGNAVRWQQTLRQAVDTGRVMPLPGLTSTFGAGPARFDLGYAESVSAVDFFVKTYTEPKLWELVRSYAQGVTDDEAFTTATGADLAAFNAAWMASIGVSVPPSLGPQPGPPSTGGSSGPRPAPTTSRAPFNPIVLVIAVVVVLVALAMVIRRVRRPPPPPPPPPPSTQPPWWGPQQPTGGPPPPPGWESYP